MSEHLIPQLKHLQYAQNNLWRVIPSWAQNLATLGQALAKYQLDGTQSLFVSMALPVQNWSASFLTLGYLLGLDHSSVVETSVERHFQTIRGLPCGTPVKLFHNDLQFDAVIYEKQQGYVLIHYTKKKNKAQTKELLCCNQSNCLKVHFMENEQFAGVRNRGQTVSDNPGFVAAMLPRGDLLGHCLGSRTEYAIVGDIGRLREEVTSRFKSGESTGCLQDVLRIDKFSRPTQDSCGMVKASMSKPEQMMSIPAVRMTVFESAAAYLRHNNILRSPITVAFLDRSERVFMNAAEAISARFTTRLPTKTEPLPLDVSHGVESIAFLEARKT